MGAKKAANLFRIYCFFCRYGAAWYSVFMVVQCGKLKSNPFSFQIGTFHLEIAHQILQHSFLAHSGQDEIY